MNDKPEVTQPERDCSIIDRVLPAINDGMAHRLFALCGAPVSVSIHVIDVNGDVHASHNFATQGDHDMFVCAIADDVRTAAQSSLSAQRVAMMEKQGSTEQ